MTTVASMLMCGLLLGMEILNLRYIGGGLWGPTFFGFLGGAASILIENRVRKKPPRIAPVRPSRVASPPTEEAPAKTVASIFFSYRREDSADVTGRIYDRLTALLGETTSLRMSIP